MKFEIIYKKNKWIMTADSQKDLEKVLIKGCKINIIEEKK